MKYLIVGLGNIGAEYDMTRHNIGFEVADAFVIKNNANYTLDRHAFVANCKIRNKQFVVIKPTTYMNLSGKAVKYWMDKEKIQLENILVILDDLALPIEALRLRAAGSPAGHNGLKSIEQLLQTDQYARLRFGIGNNYAKGHQADFVLSRWKSDELPEVKHKIAVSVDIIESFAFQGVAKTMSLFNK